MFRKGLAVMDTQHLVDPELLETIEAFPPVELSTERLPEIRAQAAAEVERLQPTLPVFPDI